MTLTATQPRVEFTQCVWIRAIHHLENPALSAEENTRIYGKCFRRHGHHYHVQITVTGQLNELSGSVVNRDELRRILQTQIVDRYDGVDLNRFIPNTACEALALHLHAELSETLRNRGISLVRVAMQETRKNYFEAPPDTGEGVAADPGAAAGAKDL